MYKIDCQYLRPKKAAHLIAWHEETFEKRQNLTTWQGRNATLLPVIKFQEDNFVHGRGGVVDENGNYVSLSAYEGRVENAYPFEAPVCRDEKVVYCGYYIPHWGHFLAEVLSRIWYCLRNDPTIDKYVFIVQHHQALEIKANYRALFDLLNIGDKIELVNEPTTYREVIIPELSFYLNRYYSQEFLDVYEAAANSITVDPDWQPFEKIYFTRSQLKKTNDCDCGFEVFDNFFAKNGYAILAPEKLSLSQMIYYIRNADVVASISGTLPHNMLFGRQGQKLQILERCVVNNDWQVSVDRIMGLQTTYIDANIPVYPVDTSGPFLMGFNDNMQRFAADNNMIPPDPALYSKKYLKATFVRFMKTYMDLYQYHWHMEPRYMPLSGYMLEAYQAGMAYFGDYLNGSRPFLPEHYLQWHYWKQLVKPALRKLGLYHG